MTLTKTTPEGDVPMTKDEEVAFLADQAQLASESSARSLREAARAELERNDAVAVRCLKAGTPYPPEWTEYDDALRSIVRSGSGTLPLRPDYPA